MEVGAWEGRTQGQRQEKERTMGWRPQCLETGNKYGGKCTRTVTAKKQQQQQQQGKSEVTVVIKGGKRCEK